ncbi:MAG: FtsX-like permease family protein [Bryobacteraceae bacterium]
MIPRFELFIARRYLSAKRKEAVISLITAISILGVAAGVMALVIALAINNGFRNTLQRNLLGATAHVSVLEKEVGFGIDNWRELIPEFRKIPHVTGAAPALIGTVFLSGPMQSRSSIIKGVDVPLELNVSETLKNLKAGSLEGLKPPAEGELPGIILGARLAQETGLPSGSVVTVISPQGELTPFGPRVSSRRFRVAGIFETGFYEVDASLAFAALPAVQETLSLEDVVNQIELRLDDLYAAPEVARAAESKAGPRFAATTWMEQSRQLLNALRLERAVTAITIGLIVLVAALNIFIVLVMMVMEKHRDIAILMSMGARHQQIRRVFMFQGALIGIVGTVIGLVTGHTLSFLADRYRWVRLDEQVYSMSFVPFDPRAWDSLWIAGIAILVSFLATLYPARSASRIAPAEVLRYE